MAVTNFFTDTITVTYSGNGKTVTGKVGSYTGTKDAGVAIVIPAGAVNQAVPITFPFANIQACVMDASQSLTVKTNSTTTPGNTINLIGTKAQDWAIDYVATKPYSADVTIMYVTNATATDSIFNVRVLYI